MKCVPVHHGIPAVLHRDEPWLHRHSENGALERKMRNLIFVKYEITRTELIFLQFRQKHLQCACRHNKSYPASDRFLYHTT